MTAASCLQPRLETELASGVVLWDASDVLPARRAPQRAVRRIRRLYVHHSGVLGQPGLAGAEASARFAVQTQGWPCAAYHYWLPYERLESPKGELVVLRLAPDGWRTFHTGGRANTHGLGIALQGNTNERPLSPAQREGLQALLPWLRARYAGQLDQEWLSWHSESGRFGGRPRASCPGKHAEAFLHAYLASLRCEEIA